MNRPDLDTPKTTKTNVDLGHKHLRHTGFTLIELLVVVAIVGVLVAITTMVGSAVINTGKKQATLGVIQTLDEALAAYIDQIGDNPPALVEIPLAKLPQSIQGATGNESAFYPAVDGRAREGTSGDLTEVNSVSLFIESASSVAQVQTTLTGINSKFIKNYSADETIQPFLLTVFDAWDNPIRYVHPKFDGIIERERRALASAGEPVNIVNPNKPYFVAGALPLNATQRVRMKFIRRNRLVRADYGDQAPPPGGTIPQGLDEFDFLPDSDGGLTSGNRPYFYSAGPDGNPSTIEDNIYSNTPQFVDPKVD